MSASPRASTWQDCRTSNVNQRKSDWQSGDVFFSGRAAREGAPYRPGDVLPFLDLTRAGEKVVREALVLRVSSEYLPRAEYWIPAYRVRVRRADGAFGNIWRRIYPGDIERGFEAREKESA